MDAFQIVAHTSRCFTVRHCLRFLKEFAQVRAGAKAWFLFAMDDQSMGILAHSLKVGGKFLQLLERERSNFIAWSAMQRQLNSTVAQIPRNGLSCVSQMLSLCPVQNYQFRNFELVLSRSLNCVHRFNLGFELRRNQVPLQLSVRSEQAVLNRKWLGMHIKRAHLLIVGLPFIQLVERGLHMIFRDFPSDDHT